WYQRHYKEISRDGLARRRRIAPHQPTGCYLIRMIDAMFECINMCLPTISLYGISRVTSQEHACNGTMHESCLPAPTRNGC
ncbi:hypothetical protein K1T71_009713, partial [Dendrolimus kikuchii]